MSGSMIYLLVCVCVYLHVCEGVCDRAPIRRTIRCQVKGSQRKTDAGVCMCDFSLPPSFCLSISPHLYMYR